MSEKVNGVEVECLLGMAENLKKEPRLGRSQFRVKNRWQSGGLNQTSIQGFFITGQEDTSRKQSFLLKADEPPALLGENRGPSPVEYLLTALASCVTSAIVYHSAARGIRIEELESEVEGDIDLQGFMGTAKDIPKGFQNIRVNFTVKTDAPPEKLKELAEFSPVLNSIRSPVPVTVTVKKKKFEEEEVLEAQGAHS